MELFFVRRAAVASAPPIDGLDAAHVIASLDAFPVPDRMPFLIDDDGTPMTALNAFFRDLPASGCRSPETWRAYAFDVFRCVRYLRTVEGVEIFEATTDHIERYRWVRLKGKKRVRESTWNRDLAALERLFAYGVRRGYMDEVPFRYGEVTGLARISGSRTPSARSGTYDGDEDPESFPENQRNLARAPLGDDAPIRFLTTEQFLFFRDVGLFGLDPDGRRDPGFRGENAFRNRLFADLLVTTGMRVTEASALTRLEVPNRSNRAAPLTIAGPTAKRDKTRTILLPAAIIDRLRFYIRGARAELVERHSGRAAAPDEIELTVTEDGLVWGADEVDLSLYEPEDRWRMSELTAAGRDPLTLFLGRAARPMRPQGWERTFEAASRRCASFASADLPDVGQVTPHMLRHTFAVHTLTAMLQVQAEKKDEDILPGTMALKRLAQNPIRRLQKLMGHSNVATTYGYLDCLDDATELVEAALDRWDADATWSQLIGAR